MKMSVKSLSAAAFLFVGLAAGRAHADDYTVAQSTPGAVASVSLSATPASIGRSQSSALSALVKDAFGGPLPLRSVSFSLISGPGSVSPAAATSDSTGKAVSNYTAPDKFPGRSVTATIRACSEGVCGDAIVTVTK